MDYFSKRTGICLFVIGIAVFLLNYFTLKLWDVDMDIFGVMIAVLGLVIVIATSSKMKKSKKWLTRKNGIWLCVIGVVIEIIIGILNILGLSSNGGESGAIVFALGMVLIAMRWKH